MNAYEEGCDAALYEICVCEVNEGEILHSARSLCCEFVIIKHYPYEHTVINGAFL